MQAEKTVKTWEKTRLQNLVHHKSGHYYARLLSNGKEIWKAIGTSYFSVGEAKLAVVLKEHCERNGKEIDASNAKMTFGEAAALHMQRVADDVSIKRRTRQYWKETLDALLRSWPNLPLTEVRRITENICREWAVVHDLFGGQVVNDASAHRFTLAETHQGAREL